MEAFTNWWKKNRFKTLVWLAGILPVWFLTHFVVVPLIGDPYHIIYFVSGAAWMIVLKVMWYLGWWA